MENHINYQRIERAIGFLENNFRHQPDLDVVAEKVHLSPFHFQRIFTEWAGISPKKFLQSLTVDFLKTKLQESKNLISAAEAAGLSSQSRVYDLFTTLEAVTPQEYRARGAGIRIEFGIHQTPFGLCLLGATERGICWLSFIQTDEDPKFEISKMKEHWTNSVFHQDQELTNSLAKMIFSRNYAKTQSKLNVFVKGIDELVFQLLIAQVEGILQEQHLQFHLKVDRGAAAFATLRFIKLFHQTYQGVPVNKFI